MSAARLLALLLCCICFGGSSALAGRRVALVIGNSTYQSAPRLPNPTNDAAAVAAMFKAINFDLVESKFDLSATNLRKTLREFADRVRDADVAVVYFAGHGIELDGANYLVPVDATLETDGDVLDETVPLDRVLFAVEPARQLRLVILDACRVNPFVDRMRRSTAVSRSTSRGLARVEPATANTLIAFAAKAGSTASDGNSSNSPFVKALIEYLPRPGLDVRRALGFVRDDVLKSTSNKQEPYVYGSLGGHDVSLVPAPTSTTTAQADPQAAVRLDYEFALQLATRDGWEAFLSRYPDGFYADLAKGQLNKIAAEDARTAAAEKARIAEQEKARLVEQGAREAELTKALARAKAAEEARIAAEAATDIAREKAAAAETTRIVEQEKAKRVEKEVAALSPSSNQSELKLRVALQDELRRVGCNTGSVDGDWSTGSQVALELFNKYAGTQFDAKIASPEALSVVKSKTGQICPRICERGFHAEGNSCVRSCPAGRELNSDGSCKKVRVRPTMNDKERARDRSAPSIRKQPADQIEESKKNQPIGLSCTRALGGCRVRCVQLGGGSNCGATICVRLHQECLRSGCWYGRTFNSCGLSKQ